MVVNYLALDRCAKQKEAQMSQLTEEERVSDIRRKYAWHSKLEPCGCDGCYLVAIIDRLVADNESLVQAFIEEQRFGNAKVKELMSKLNITENQAIEFRRIAAEDYKKLTALTEAADVYLERWHPDSCSSMHAQDLPCSCGYDRFKEAVKAAKGE